MGMSLRVADLVFWRCGNLHVKLEIASPSGLDTFVLNQQGSQRQVSFFYLFSVLYFTRCGVKSLPNFSVIIVS